MKLTGSIVRHSLFRVAATAFSVALLCGPLHAGTVTTNQTAPIGDALTLINFNGIAAAGSYVAYGMGPLTLSGATFTSNDQMFVIDPGYYGFPYAGGGFLNSDYTSPDIITVTLPEAANYVAFDFGSLFTGGATFEVTLGGMGPYSAFAGDSVQTGVLDFVSFTSTTSFTTVTLSMPDAPNYNAIDNFEFGTTVPEPATLLLVGGGLALIARRKARV